MMSNDGETKTYFGESLDEVLPKIRDELGPDALIVRQREGIVGGIGGFFGRKCVEVEARPSLARQAAMPPRAIVDAYDTGDPFEPLLVEPELDFSALEADTLPPPPGQNRLLETLLAQTSPFAEQLSSALAVEPIVAAEPEPEPEPEVAPAPEPEPRRTEPAPIVPARSIAALPPVSTTELAALRDELVAASVPVKLAGDILTEVERALRPFDPGTPLRELTRRALARRIPVAHGWRSRRRTIAVIGLSGAGRTLAAASLCAAYAAAGRSVAAISLEPARTAMRLGELTRPDDVLFEIADAPDLVPRARDAVQAADVVVADAPPLADAIDGARLASTLALLDALEPDETHLVLPAGTSAADGRTIIESLGDHKPTRLIVSHADDQRPSGVPVGLALAHRIPVAFVGTGAAIGRLRPAEPDSLSRMVLQ